MKRCTTCKQHKPLTEYCKNKNTKDGLDYYCHACILIRVKKYQAKDKYISDEEAIKISRKCSTCKELKCLLDFYKKKTNKYGYSFQCKVCAENYRRVDREKTPLKYKMRIRRHNLKAKFGLEPEDYADILEKQGMSCAICKTTEPRGKYGVFAVDHDPKTNFVRGLLCTNCNLGIGNLQDSKENMLNAISYLENNLSTSAERLYKMPEAKI